MLHIIALLFTTASLVSGLQLNVPGNLDDSGNTVVTWTIDPFDPPTFRLLLACICAPFPILSGNTSTSSGRVIVGITNVDDGNYWLRAIDDKKGIISNSNGFILMTVNGERSLSPLPPGSSSLPPGVSTTTTIATTTTGNITVSSASVSITSSTNATAASTTAAPTSTPTVSPAASHASSQVRIIVGANIGGLVALLLTIFLLFAL